MNIWTNVPDGTYEIEAFGKSRKVTITRMVKVEMDMGAPNGELTEITRSDLKMQIAEKIEDGLEQAR